MRTTEETVSWIIFLQREDFSTTFTDSSSCCILSKASSLSLRRGLVKLQLLTKNPLKLLPVATRQTSPCKYTFLTDSNASLWLFSSINHETFLEIYLAKRNIFSGYQTVYWQKLPKICFRKLSSTRIIIKRKWHHFFTR